MYTTVWILTAVLAADFATGLVHWLEDTYLTPDTTTGIVPFDSYLRQVARDNDRHHSDPRSMLEYNWLENISTSLPPVAVISGMIETGLWVGWLSDAWWWGLTIILGGSGNVFHRFAHERGPVVVVWLQSAGVLQSREQHKRHHYTGQGLKMTKLDPLTDYCVITTLLNPVLDGMRWWRGLEWIIEKTTGIKSNHKIQILPI